MKNNYCFFTVFLFVMTFAVNGQIAISHVEEIPKLKKGATYVVMKNPESPQSKEYVDIIKNNWTLSKVEFIKYDELSKYISPESSFLTLSGYETSKQFTTLYQNGSSKSGINYSTTHIYLELWTCNAKYFENTKKKEFGDKNKVQVARVELFTDFPALSDPDLLFQSDYDGGGHIRNWSPGILKNQIQALTFFVNKGEPRKLFTGVENKAEIEKLKKDVLYVPDYVLIKFNKFTGNESQKHSEKDVFEDYKFKYKLLTTAELNQKILNDKTPFYYMIYIKSSTDKYISVINSLTGEIVYTKYAPVSYNIKSSDLKNIVEK